jgi:heme/copper-type cytochrome/quinol oxidase subunit 1
LQGERLELPNTSRVLALERDATDLNAFIAGFDIAGCGAPARRRIFAIPPGMPIKITRSTSVAGWTVIASACASILSNAMTIGFARMFASRRSLVSRVRFRKAWRDLPFLETLPWVAASAPAPSYGRSTHRDGSSKRRSSPTSFDPTE